VPLLVYFFIALVGAGILTVSMSDSSLSGSHFVCEASHVSGG
jgi:hypothetical protein